MTAALAWTAAAAAFIGVAHWMHPDCRAYRSYRRSIAAQARPCPCGCGNRAGQHSPIRLPRQRTNRES